MAHSNNIRENKMGTMPVGKLLLSMSLPIMASMIVQALYNIVDSIFVSKLNEEALTAVSLVFPIQNLMISIAAGTGVGINSLLAKSLGEKNQEEANNTAVNGIFCLMASAALFAVLGVAFSDYFFSVQTTDPLIRAYGRDYMMVCCIFSFGLFGQICTERLLQATGRTIYTMITQTIGAVINIILDPIFIFGLFGFPRLEVAGAAIATVIGQIVAMLIGFYLNLYKNPDISISFKGFRPKRSTLKRIYSVGVPSMLMGSVGSIMTFGLNNILIAFSSTATAVFGVYFRLQSFIFMPVFGLNNGMIPIISYNYGARNKKRVTDTMKYSIIFATSIMVVGFTVFQVVPLQLLSMFDASPDMVRIGVTALRIISYSFLCAGFCIVASAVMQSLGYAFMSLSVTVARQLIVLLPTAWLLSRTGILDYVWLSFPIAEIMSLTASLFFLLYVYRKVIKPMAENTAK